MLRHACLIGMIVLLAACSGDDREPVPEGRTPHAADTPAEQEAAMTGKSAAELRKAEKAEPAGVTSPGSSEDAKPSAASDGPGPQVYRDACSSCHEAGIAGAPKIGDSEAWGHRIAKGMETLVHNAVKGFQGSQGVMPPKGGDPSLTEDDVEAAVRYMVDQSR